MLLYGFCVIIHAEKPDRRIQDGGKEKWEEPAMGKLLEILK